MKATANTKAERPTGNGWLHLVRRPSAAKGLGGWYANIGRESEEGRRAYEFALWFESQLRAKLESAEVVPAEHPISLWLHETPRLHALAYRTPAVWRAISDLLPLVARDDFHGWDSVRISTLHGRDLGLYDPALKAEGEANLLMAKAWDIADECVTLFWMPRLEKRIVQQAQEEIARTVEMLRNETPDFQQLDAGRLPPPPEDARFRRTDQALDPRALAPFFEDARIAAGVFHDQVLTVLQAYLRRLAGQSLLALEDNKKLAREVLELVDSYGAKLFFRDSHGVVRSVRVHAVPVTGRHKDADSTAVKAGKFSVLSTGGKAVTVTQTATFPSLVAARDLVQAEKLFTEMGSKAVASGHSESQ